ncbi:MAG: SDR family oxidoreductase [Gammaproteobacteria bacterium]|nr:SDR family oxidoreductase [Gammaproteobacteria bacterium]
MNISLTGKRAFITGGGDGMGKATALALHKLGAVVSVCDIDQAALSSLPDGINTSLCDVGDPAQIDALFDQLQADGLDILINNAGVGGPTKPIEEISYREWRDTLNVCLDSQFLCTRRAVPIFKQQGHGVIINLISAAGIMGYPNRSPYVVAKYAAQGFTKTMAMELGPDNIRVNGIVPGNVNGDRMNRVVAAHAAAENLSEEDVRRRYAIGTSMQCYVEPDEIADLICYLVSD